jgi:hypothetical protein
VDGVLGLLVPSGACNDKSVGWEVAAAVVACQRLVDGVLGLLVPSGACNDKSVGWEVAAAVVACQRLVDGVLGLLVPSGACNDKSVGWEVAAAVVACQRLVDGVLGLLVPSGACEIVVSVGWGEAVLVVATPAWERLGESARVAYPSCSQLGVCWGCWCRQVGAKTVCTERLESSSCSRLRQRCGLCIM